MNNLKTTTEKAEFEKLVDDYTHDTSWLREYHLDPTNPDKEKVRQILKRELYS
jgi:hypothetical protein